jgi:glycosyltransferase involved in cell wall biosynthesis
MRIALFSPLNPVSTGIADYTEEMLGELGRHFEIDLYISPGYQPVNQERLAPFRVFPFEASRFDPSVYQEIVYHMGNFYEGHRYIYESLKRFPGIVVLHDYVLQGFYAERFEATRDFESYRSLLIKYYGEKGKEIAQGILERHPVPIWESEQAFYFPMNEEILEYAKALIVHSDYVKNRVQVKTQKPIVKIPHHGHILREFDRAAIRESLGIKDDEVMICSAGYVNKNKRYDRILAALAEMPDLNYKYVIAGKDRGRILENYLPRRHTRILLRDHLPLLELEGLIAAADICINLRYPTMGESSGSLLRMMGYGKPTLVTNYGSYAEFPDYCVLKVEADIDETHMIKRYLQALASDEEFRASVGREASDYVKNECGIAKCARAYAHFIEEQQHAR